MRYPFEHFRLGTRYGTKGKYWKCGWHSGLDLLSAAYGGDGLVYPLCGGQVMKVAKSDSYGNYVMVKHEGGYVTLYAHLRTVYVRNGMMVGEDTVLGVEGMSGNATGRHLHIEVHKGGYSYPAKIDPLEFINRGMEVAEVEKNIKIRLNGREKVISAIEKGGHNYVKLQDLRDERLVIGYDADKRVPVISVRNA